MFYAYVLVSEHTGRFYIGSTQDISERLVYHNSGFNQSTKPYRPWRLLYSEPFDTLAEARRRERQIKAWKSRDYMIKTLGLPV